MQIKKFSPANHYVRCTIYGSSWVGKTVFGGTAPKPIYASAEDWLLSVVSTLWYSPDYARIESVADLQELYSFLAKWDHDYETLVIDSLTEINEIIKTNMEKSINRWLQIQDWAEVSKKIKEIIKGIKSLPMHVIIICQEKNVTDGDKITKRVPMLNGKNATEIAYMMDIVGYLYIDSDGNRHLTTQPHEKLECKDRSGKIGNDAPLNFTEWVDAISTLDIKNNIDDAITANGNDDLIDELDQLAQEQNEMAEKKQEVKKATAARKKTPKAAQKKPAKNIKKQKPTAATKASDEPSKEKDIADPGKRKTATSDEIVAFNKKLEELSKEYKMIAEIRKVTYSNIKEEMSKKLKSDYMVDDYNDLSIKELNALYNIVVTRRKELEKEHWII